MATNEAELEGAVGAIESNGSEAGGIAPAEIGDVFVRKLRRRDTLLVRRLNEVSVHHLERELFDTVYKGITDVVTKYVWPVPAYWVTRICSRLHVHPNLITLIGIAAMIMATILWARGELVAGMLFAWLMTFLDTVDGKLARVTATSSKLGDRLDHITDIIHPPIWWAALAYGLAGQADAVQRPLVWGSCLIILVGYFVGRTIETAFKTRFRYNCYLWRPFDSAFRLVVSRRNIILLIMTAGLILGVPIAAFVAAAAWTLISGVIQVVRLAQAYRAGQDGSLPSWLM